MKNGQLTIDLETLKKIFQIENEDYFMEADLTFADDEMDAYHLIFNGIKSTLAPYFDKNKSAVKTFKSYAGENDKNQYISFIDFESPASDGLATERHLAMLLYYFIPNQDKPDTFKIAVCFGMHGILQPTSINSQKSEFVPLEAKYRKFVGQSIELAPIDVTFPNNVKGAICYADATFRCFLDGEILDFSILQDWLDIDAYAEVAARYDELLHRDIDGLMIEITNDEDLNLADFEGQFVFDQPPTPQ